MFYLLQLSSFLVNKRFTSHLTPMPIQWAWLKNRNSHDRTINKGLSLPIAGAISNWKEKTIYRFVATLFRQKDHSRMHFLATKYFTIESIVFWKTANPFIRLLFFLKKWPKFQWKSCVWLPSLRRRKHSRPPYINPLKMQRIFSIMVMSLKNIYDWKLKSRR